MSRPTEYEIQVPDFSGQSIAVNASIPGRLRDLKQNAGRAVALKCGDTELTWTEFYHDAALVANRLAKQGLNPGDRVAVLAGNSIEYLSILLGIITAGCCAVPLSTMLQAETLAGMIADCNAKALFVSQEFVPIGNDLSGLSPDCVVGIGFATTGIQSLGTWVAGVEDRQPELQIDPVWPFNIMYSSGTTGVPKGIVQSHWARTVMAAGLVKVGLNPSSVCLISTGLYTNLGLTAFFGAMWSGAKTVLLRHFEPANYLKTAQAEGVTHHFLVPNQVARLLGCDQFNHTDLSATRFKYFGGAGMATTLKQEFCERWPGATMEAYGMSEGAPATAIFHDRVRGRFDSVGLPMGSAETKIIDRYGQEITDGTIGEVVGRSGMMMTGYFGRPDATEALIWRDADGLEYFRSGDLGYLDDQGYLYIKGRSKEVIISGGMNIYAVDLERVLMQHTSVADAAVVAIADERWGESPVAVVELKEYETESPEDLRNWANARLGKYQRISKVHVWPCLPRNAMHKVVKTKILDVLQQKDH